MLAEILSIGDELLIGQVINTNAAWMASQLNKIGVEVKKISSVGDDEASLLEALQLATNRVDIILMTGGLGPTKDDITKKILASYFEVKMRQDQESLENIKSIFKHHPNALLESNIHQAEVLENAIVLPNRHGTAPGMWIEKNGKVYVALPGIPFEMKHLMEAQVIPRLQKRSNLSAIVHHTILSVGIVESALAAKIADIEDRLPKHIKLAYLPQAGQVRLRLSAYGADQSLIQKEILLWSYQLIDRLDEYVISAGEDIPIEKSILNWMAVRKLTLVTAESCTGGYLAHLMTQHTGSSAVFLGGLIAYANVSKQRMLAVDAETLASHSAVSEQTVREMAMGALQNYHSDYAIAVSGIAGPDGGTSDKPVGTIWIAVANKTSIQARQFSFGHQRMHNIACAATYALAMFFKFLQADCH